MNTEQLPEAIRLAEKLRDVIHLLDCDFADDIDTNDLKLAAMELESLHARVQELEGRTMQTNKTVSGDGWKLVPVEATPEMVDAYYRHNNGGAAADWSAMVNAAPQPMTDALDAGRSDAEIVAQTEALARHLMSWRWGQVPEQPDTKMRNSENPRAQGCWQIACDIQALITSTDAENAAAEVDAEVDTEVDGLKVVAAVQKLAARGWFKPSRCADKETNADMAAVRELLAKPQGIDTPRRVT